MEAPWSQLGAKIEPRYAVFLPKKATKRIDKIAVPLIFGGVPPYKDLRSNLRSAICRHAGCILQICKIAMIGDINLGV